MKTRQTSGILILAILLAAVTFAEAQAQDLHPSRRPSPIGIAKTHVGDTYVKITYGRPYVRGRQIFGANNDSTTYLVPFGQVWRTGANEATEITLTGPLMVGGQRLDAGTYSIFTEPGAETWVIHVSPHLGLDGTGNFNPATQTFTQVFDPADNVLTLNAPSHTVEDVVDQFTISLRRAGEGADMVLAWEKTEVRVPIRPAM